MGNKSGNFAKRQKNIIFMKYGEPPFCTIDNIHYSCKLSCITDTSRVPCKLLEYLVVFYFN